MTATVSRAVQPSERTQLADFQRRRHAHQRDHHRFQRRLLLAILQRAASSKASPAFDKANCCGTGSIAMVMPRYWRVKFSERSAPSARRGAQQAERLAAARGQAAWRIAPGLQARQPVEAVEQQRRRVAVVLGRREQYAIGCAQRRAGGARPGTPAASRDRRRTAAARASAGRAIRPAHRAPARRARPRPPACDSTSRCASSRRSPAGAAWS